MTPGAVEVALADGARVVDARTGEQFDEAHVPGAISVPASDTGFATRVAQVVEPDAGLIVVAASDGYELEAAGLLASVGLSVGGFLDGGMTAWRSEGRPVERLRLLDAAQLSELLEEAPETVVLDVRDAGELEQGRIPGSVNIPCRQIPERLGELSRDATLAAVCGEGKRSGLAASVLQAAGFGDVIHVGHGGRRELGEAGPASGDRVGAGRAPVSRPAAGRRARHPGGGCAGGARRSAPPRRRSAPRGRR
ncbi:MAG: rhodanese-like domain-containing protein [Solirubrobacterales bacterium]